MSFSFTHSLLRLATSTHTARSSTLISVICVACPMSDASLPSLGFRLPLPLAVCEHGFVNCRVCGGEYHSPKASSRRGRDKIGEVLGDDDMRA